MKTADDTLRVVCFVALFVHKGGAFNSSKLSAF